MIVSCVCCPEPVQRPKYTDGRGLVAISEAICFFTVSSLFLLRVRTIGDVLQLS